MSSLIQTTFLDPPDLAPDLKPAEPLVGVLIRVTAAEREILNRRARDAETSTNRYVRRRLGLDEVPYRSE